MLKQVLHKLFSITMALLLLLSTASFTVVKSFCGDVLIDTAVFQKAESCGMDMVIHAETTITKGCCKEEIEVVKGQEDLNLNTHKSIDFNQKLVLTSFVYTYLFLFESLPKQIISHKNYSPPNLIADIQVLDQVFLI
tara:strand:+ start:1308 stop:1718 length:411 start_codon:yes stop_codon:yes gene_type:complete